VHNIPVLVVNLVAALVLSCGWFYVINSDREILALPRMRWAKFVTFLPFVVAAAGLWLALHG
jgi:hypothetical protein